MKVIRRQDSADKRGKMCQSREKFETFQECEKADGRENVTVFISQIA